MMDDFSGMLIALGIISFMISILVYRANDLFLSGMFAGQLVAYLIAAANYEEWI